MQSHVSLERRRQARGTPGGAPGRTQLVSTIIGMYREMPGLTLHLRQAARLFGVPTSTCQVVLDDLVKKKLLRRKNDGQYARRDGS